MNLSGDDTERALYCVVELIEYRRRFGVPIPGWMLRLHQRFDLASLTSPSGHETVCDEPQLNTEVLIGSREAANILGLSTRHVRRLAADLDGERRGRDWWFKTSTVTEYAEGKQRG